MNITHIRVCDQVTSASLNNIDNPDVGAYDGYTKQQRGMEMHKVKLVYDDEVIADGESHFYSDALESAFGKMPVMYMAVPEDVTMLCEKPNGKIIKLPLSVAMNMPDNLDQYKAEAALKRLDAKPETKFKYPD